MNQISSWTTVRGSRVFFAYPQVGPQTRRRHKLQAYFSSLGLIALYPEKLKN